MQELPLTKIVSGGQTGVDRAALDVAIGLGIPHGGWCPRGRLAEDGPIAGKYHLIELDSADYAARTERNVIDSTGTLILHQGRLKGGTELTSKLALRHRRPFRVVELDPEANAAAVRKWLILSRIDILNVAGPRESTSPGIHRAAVAFLRQVLAGWKPPLEMGRAAVPP